MADNSIVKTIQDAEIDARSLSEFIYKPASFMVSRRLAPPVHTLDYYVRKLDGIEQQVQDAINNTAIDGSVLADTFVTVTANGGTVARTQRDKNSDYVSVEDFGAVGNGIDDDTAAFQAAIDSGLGDTIVINLTSGSYYIKSQLTITNDNVEIHGNGAAVQLFGDGLADGGHAIVVDANNFKVSNVKFTTSKRIVAIRILPSTQTISNFHIDSCTFENVFYAVRSGGLMGATGVEPTIWTKNITISNCVSAAWSGANASHFVCSDSDNISMYNNRTFGGQNASAMGGHTCKNLRIINNYEFGMVDILAGADAGIQIENSENAVITGNITSHDIWVDDSSNVAVAGNNCRRLRVTVSEKGGTFDGILYDGNIAKALTVSPYSNQVPPDTRVNAIFTNNTIMSTGNISGNPISRAIAIDGAIAGKITLSGNNVAADAAEYGIAVVRNSGLTLRANNNNFGTKPNLVSGGGGLVYERANTNPIYKTKSGYIYKELLGNITPASSEWTTLNLTSNSADVNSEYTSGTFTAKDDGYYVFSATISARVSSNAQLGLRVQGVSSELHRGFLRKYTDNGVVSNSLKSPPIFIKAGDTAKVQYYATGVTEILLGSTTSLSINKV